MFDPNENISDENKGTGFENAAGQPIEESMEGTGRVSLEKRQEPSLEETSENKAENLAEDSLADVPDDVSVSAAEPMDDMESIAAEPASEFDGTDTSASQEGSFENIAGEPSENPEETAASAEQTEVESEQPSVREYHYEEQVKKSPKRRKNAGRFVAACLIASIAGGASAGIGYGAVRNYFDSHNPAASSPIVVQKAAGRSSFSAVDIIKTVKPSVVSISTKFSGQAPYIGSFSIPYEGVGAGSGVVFYSDDSKIAIVTNNHVIEEADSIYVVFDDEKSVAAKVVGAESKSDLAVLTVSWDDLKKAGVDDVTVATFGDSDALEVGEAVIAIGNAMGKGISATDGIISMTEQKISVDGNELNVLQTSAAINGGNSGGALVNSAGQVIGINTAKYNSTMAEGMGYAIPSNEIAPLANDLLEAGTQPKPYIGVTGTSITTENASLYRLPVGALIMEVTEGGPAEEAGLKVGDIVTEYDGKTVMDMDTLVTLVNETSIGDTVTMHVVRDGKEGLDLNLTIRDKNNP